MTGTKIRTCGAATSTLGAIMARRTAIQGLGEDGQARRDAENIELVARFLDDQLCAAWFGRRKENAIWGIGNILFGAEHSDVRFHSVVVRSDVVVTDRPVFGKSITRLGFEIDGSKPERDAAPMVRAAAYYAGAKPVEICARS